MGEAEPAEGVLTAEGQADALAALRYHWDDGYEIEVADGGEWRARRRDGLGGWMTAGTPGALLCQIRADYAVKPVTRPGRPAGRELACADVAVEPGGGHAERRALFEHAHPDIMP